MRAIFNPVANALSFVPRIRAGEKRAGHCDFVSKSPDHELVGCPDCGMIQTLDLQRRGGSLRCGRCRSVLERMNGRSLDGALACSLATFLLLFPANLLPVLQVTIASETNHSLIGSSVLGLWAQNWPLVAIIIGLEIVILPFVRFGLLTCVLGAIWLGRQPAWLGRGFRWAEMLDQWAMPDVFLFGGLVGYARVAAVLPIRLQPGGYCLIAAALFALITRASLERRELWRRIGPVATKALPDMICCTACDFPVPASAEGGHCPRCAATVWRCHPYSAMRAMALTAAALVFYPAAYLYPMEYNDRAGSMDGYSIMTGVTKLIQADLWFFAAVVFIASIVIPLLKIFALAWCGFSIHRHSGARLVFKTKLCRLVDLIGRWSHIDPFTVAVFLPLMRLPELLSVIVGRALPAFLAVVVLTMLASEVFDTRALWLAGRRS